MRMTDAERASYEQDGFLVRRGVFGAEDLDALRDASEEVVAQLVAHRTGRRLVAGSYTFELEALAGTIIKWEGDSDVVHGIEPFVHLHPTFQKYAEDPRFVELAKDLVGSEDIGLFTEKLNYKRARAGGPVVLHQDHPYWVDSVDDMEHTITIMLLLDDSDESNGCLEVVPGSHAWGLQPGKDIDGFGKFEMDDAAFDMSLLQPVPLAAGDFVAFGPDLVHRSLPNRSAGDRRAFLYTYQPAGLRTQLENLRRLTSPRS
jgi:ectoine hydroxylase